MNRRSLLGALFVVPFALLGGREVEPWRAIRHYHGPISYWLGGVAVAQDGAGAWYWGWIDHVEDGQTMVVILDHPADSRDDAMVQARAAWAKKVATA